MPKSKKSNKTNLIIIIALALAAVGFYTYRYMLSPAQINKVTSGQGESGGSRLRVKPGTARIGGNGPGQIVPQQPPNTKDPSLVY